MKRWWGPGPQDPVSLAELDVRVGGRFRIELGQYLDGVASP